LDLETAFNLVRLATTVAENLTTGGAAKTTETIGALEDMTMKIAQGYKAIAGKPLDLSLLTYEEPIP
jgi:hypothetical protein